MQHFPQADTDIDIEPFRPMTYQSPMTAAGYSTMSAPNDQNISTQIQSMKDKIKDATEFIRDYKEEIETLKIEIDVMRADLITLNEQNQMILNPVIKNNFSYFKEAKKKQENENKELQEQLTVIKKEKANIEAAIDHANDVLDKMKVVIIGE